ncbi:MAG: aspartate aminotransferase family protein [Acidobacteriota bacterium]|jgi:predicted acetylornithine/succinylornithine family transaminase|nr:aspartate aminotransferase family protein [Acidobacteriota bacterium]
MGTDAGMKLKPEEIRDIEAKYLFQTYKRAELYCARGKGPYVFDLENRRYLDFLAGISVNNLGYNHPRIASVIAEQGTRLVHCSNLFYNQYQGLLAKRLVELSGMSRAFFCNSGTEAIEAAMKIARAYGVAKGRQGKTKILSLRNSFHGRTFGALSITAQEKYQAPFRPLVPDAAILEEITISALERAFSDEVCAIVLEPVQGEGGVFPMPPDFMRAVRELCDRHDAIFIADEIQCGLGRTGKWFGFEHYDVRPDVITLAKSLAAGYPLGAVLGNEKVAGVLSPGDHGTTFGGGPLACRLALEVLAVIEDEGLLARVQETGDYLKGGIQALGEKHSVIGELRGLGLMIGVELGGIAKEVVDRLLVKGVIANATHDTVLRLIPPLVITKDHCDEFLSMLHAVLCNIDNERNDL